LKSNALIAGTCAIDLLVVERSWQRCSESVGFSALRLARLRRDARWHRRDLHDTTAGASGQRRNEVEFRWPSHKCDFELRGDVVKAEACRVERSESLDDAEHSSILIVVMADFW
jgi:hypothetical protein